MLTLVTLVISLVNPAVEQSQKTIFSVCRREKVHRKCLGDWDYSSDARQSSARLICSILIRRINTKFTVSSLLI